MNNILYYPVLIVNGILRGMTSLTLERLKRRIAADEDRTILVSTVGPYAIAEAEDLYFRCLYAALKGGWFKPSHG